MDYDYEQRTCVNSANFTSSIYFYVLCCFVSIRIKLHLINVIKQLKVLILYKLSLTYHLNLSSKDIAVNTFLGYWYV